MRLLRFAVIVAVAGFGLTSVQGQVRVVRHGDERLAGITAVDVLVRVTPDRDAPCATARVHLQEVAINALREVPLTATLSEKSASWFYTVLVTVASTAAGRSCAAAVATELIAHVEAMPDADRAAPPGTWGSLLVGELPLVRDSALVTTPAKAHDAAVHKVLRAQLASLGRRIRAANP